MSHIHIRPHTKDDMSFIYSSWLKSCRGDEDFKDLPKDKYYATYKTHVEDLMSRSQIDIACDPTDHNFILGYIVYQVINGVFILHWAYTKMPNRKLGVFRTLLRRHVGGIGDEPVLVTYRNERRRSLFEKYKMAYKPEYRRVG